MAAISNIFNLVACGLTAVLGTGTKGCMQKIKKATSFWFVPAGFEFDGTQTLDKTYIQLLQAQGNLIILKGIKSFTPETADDVTETLPDGTEQVVTLGKYKFASTFINGMAFHAALHSLNSFGKYDVLFVDGDGNIFGSTGESGTLKGFSVGMLQGAPLMFPSDSEGQKEGIGFQLTERAEMDRDYGYVQQAQLGTYYPNKEDGINEVVLSFNAVPADAGTTIVIDAKNKQNGQAWTGGLTGDFLIQRDGVTESQTVVEASGTYTFTVAALSANEVITVQLYDSSNSRAVILKDVDLYKSAVVTSTVV